VTWSNIQKIRLREKELKVENRQDLSHAAEAVRKHHAYVASVTGAPLYETDNHHRHHYMMMVMIIRFIGNICQKSEHM